MILVFVLVFVLGAVVGSFLNVCIARLPLEKSIFWPGSRCGHCFQPIRGWDNIPLISYWVLGGRCRTCKARFSMNYFYIELLTALCFVGLFYFEVVVNVNSLVYADSPRLIRQPRENDGDFAKRVEKRRAALLYQQRWEVERGMVSWRAWVGFLYHAVLLSFLLVATFCDLNGREIPLPLTVTGTVIGLVGAILLPWPWPSTPELATAGIQPGRPWTPPQPAPGLGLYPWPVWGPLPHWLAPGGNWQTGLATGVAGLLVGTFMMRAVGFLFTTGLGKEALGLGDADLMMMVGAFVGWQVVVVAFLVAAPVALVLTGAQLIVILLSLKRMIRVKVLFPKEGKLRFRIHGQPVDEKDLAETLDRCVRETGKTNVFVFGPGTMEETISALEKAAKKTAVRKVHMTSLLPFGPSLAVGSLIALLGWHWIGPRVQMLFFFGTLMAILAVSCCVFMLMASYIIRLVRLGQE
jgi:leader peptidase (prepilin peptidase)/N-methyltransferase